MGVAWFMLMNSLRASWIIPGCKAEVEEAPWFAGGGAREREDSCRPCALRRFFVVGRANVSMLMG